MLENRGKIKMYAGLQKGFRGDSHEFDRPSRRRDCITHLEAGDNLGVWGRALALYVDSEGPRWHISDPNVLKPRNLGSVEGHPKMTLNHLETESKTIST
jgi:hypothetical protein